MSDETPALPPGPEVVHIPTVAEIMEMYGDLADAPPDLLEAARDAVADSAWREVLSEAERAKHKQHPFGGLADLAESITLVARTGTIERYRLKALDVERAANELLEEIDRVAIEADNFMERDPARGEDGDERKRLSGERGSLLGRLAEHAPTVAAKAQRLRELL